MKKNELKVKTEQQTRKDMLWLAKHQGCETELRQIFERYDRLMRDNPDPVARKQIAVMGSVEVHRLLNVRGGLAIMHTNAQGEIVGGDQIIPHDPALDQKE